MASDITREDRQLEVVQVLMAGFATVALNWYGKRCSNCFSFALQALVVVACS